MCRVPGRTCCAWTRCVIHSTAFHVTLSESGSGLLSCFTPLYGPCEPVVLESVTVEKSLSGWCLQVMNRDELLNSLEDIATAFDMRVRPYSATSGQLSLPPFTCSRRKAVQHLNNDQTACLMQRIMLNASQTLANIGFCYESCLLPMNWRKKERNLFTC